ncbi:MAG TPA: alpha/beta hydrolase [Chthoniobacteraceae bacterium]|nr:alpha/beta hydrolase [Chthoniobacteraceae bacterium]
MAPPISQRLLFLARSLAFLALFLCAGARAAHSTSLPPYQAELNIPYCTVDGHTETLNAFIPSAPNGQAPAMVEIHGGWFEGGSAAGSVEQVADAHLFMQRGFALFSVNYRLGGDGGFPQCIRDCRNAIRYVRKNAAHFHIDPERIGCMGGSAGGHLSLMVAMAPEQFDDGGPVDDLKGISAKVCAAFSWIPPTDFLRFWAQGPEDVISNAYGQNFLRQPDRGIPSDSRPHLRRLFHGVIPDTDVNRALYTAMSPIGHVQRDLPPLLICDGERDPIVTGQHGKALYEQLKLAGADATYWLTIGGGHAFPGGAGFQQTLAGFVDRSFHTHS